MVVKSGATSFHFFPVWAVEEAGTKDTFDRV
jgi:hypothetical protein